MREFEGGATRDDDTGKLDYEGFLSPFALRRFAEYMHKHRVQKDGKLRESDNWQAGIPLDAYMKSGFRHFVDWWTYHRSDLIGTEEQQEAICALLFNAFGYLHETLNREKKNEVFYEATVGHIYPCTHAGYCVCGRCK